MYERKHQPLLSRRHFVRRLVRHAGLAVALVSFSLGLGMAGYHYFEGLDWLDAFLNAAMLLGGMGPVNPPVTPAGKLFAGSFALYAGLVFLVFVGLGLAPFVHRVLHRFHLEQEE